MGVREPTLLGRILHASARDIVFDVVLKVCAVALLYLRPYFIQRLLECLSADWTEVDHDTDTWTPRDQAYVSVPHLQPRLTLS